MRKHLLSARAGKVELSALVDKLGLSAHADKDCFPDKSTLSVRADNIFFSDKPGLSERTPLRR